MARVLRSALLALAALLLLIGGFAATGAPRKGLGFGFRIDKHAAGGIPGSAAQVYDARFGTDTVTAAATGWDTFGLHAGNRQVWVNSSGGNDANSCLSATLSCATFAHAWSVYVAGTSGDQFMMAGTGGRTYTDPGTSWWRDFSGLSATYPNAVLSYDPADAANTAKYGKLVGVDMPRLLLVPGQSSYAFSAPGDTNSCCYAVQGIAFAPTDGVSEVQLSYVGRHDNIVFQNDRFNTVNLSFDGAASAFGTATKANVSKSAFWGQWGSGGAVAVFAHQQDAFWFQDNVSAHVGWKIGAARDDTSVNGGANVFSHVTYLHATTTNNRLDRNTFVDTSADGLNVRGDGIVTQAVSWDEPIAGTIGGFSCCDSERSAGVVITVTDWMAMGGAHIDDLNARGYLLQTLNTIAGSSVHNVAAFDNPVYGTTNNFHDWAQHADSNNLNLPIDTYLTLDTIHGYNYSPTLDRLSGGNTAQIHLTYSNDVLDVLAAGSNNSVWGGGTYPNAKTRDQVATAMLTGAGITPGANYLTRKAQLVNAMLWRPDLPWAQAFISIGLPAYGLIPTYASIPPPSMVGQTPDVIYSLDVTPPTLTLPTGTSTGGTTATIGATTNENTGVLYGVVSASATPANVYQVLHGQDSTGGTAAFGGTVSVSASGANTIAATGLTNGTTYWADLAHRDAAGNLSNVVTSASFTTSAAWTPLSASTPLSTWFDPSDITTLFKDTACSTPVTASGDLVACMKDKSSNHLNATQSTSGNRPIYQANSGKPYLAMDGSATFLTTPSGQVVNATNGTHSAAAAVIFTNNTGVQAVLDSFQTGTIISQFLRNNGGASETFDYNTAGADTMNDGGGAITAATATTLIELSTTTTAENFVNNVSNGSSAIFGAGPLQNGTNTLGIGATNVGGNHMLGRYYGSATWSGTLSTSDRNSAHTFFFGKMFLFPGLVFARRRRRRKGANDNEQRDEARSLGELGVREHLSQRRLDVAFPGQIAVEDNPLERKPFQTRGAASGPPVPDIALGTRSWRARDVKRVGHDLSFLGTRLTENLRAAKFGRKRA